MITEKSYKTELDPNNEQRQNLVNHAGAARFAYNWGLSRRIEEYKNTGKSSTGFEQHKQLNALKSTEFPWMYEVSKCAPQEALRDVDRAFQNFFRRCKEDKANPGFPKFKNKKYGRGSFRLTGHILIEANRVRLPRIGWIRLKESNYIPTKGKVLSCTISEKVGHWFISVLVKEEIHVPENSGSAVGIDLGLSTFAVGSNGFRLEPPRLLNKSLKKLRKLSREHSKKQEGSNNRKKAARKLAKLHYRIANQRKDFLHKATTELARTKSVIVMETLNITGMCKLHSLARSIMDAGWGEFIRQLEYKCPLNGSALILAPLFFPSTKTCSNCGEIKKSMELSERVYICERCGLTIDRDLNAARNLLNLLSTASSAGSHVCGDHPLGRSKKQKPGTVEKRVRLGERG